MDPSVVILGSVIGSIALVALILGIVAIILSAEPASSNVVNLNGTVTLSPSQSGSYFLLDASLGNQTITLPPATAGVVGTFYTFAMGNSGSGAITITAGSPYTISGWLTGDTNIDAALDATANIIFQPSADQLNFFIITCVSSLTPTVTASDTHIANWIFNGHVNGSQITFS